MDHYRIHRRPSFTLIEFLIILSTLLIIVGMAYRYKPAVRVVDGCEYIQYYNKLTHKGNCTNIIHLPKK